MFPKLFLPDPFKIIRDQETGAWRSYRPYLDSDAERFEEARPAPSLMPPRLWSGHSVAWESKKENQPTVVRLHNGSEIFFFSSLGKPPQGSQFSLAWFDEEIVDPQWYPEIAARLLYRRGRFIWSATPQAGTDQLFALHEKAEAEAMLPNPGIQEFVILLEDNKHISDEAKREMAEKLSEDERVVRIGGEFVSLASRVYPEYRANQHLIEVDWFDIPKGWTRGVVIDPGRQVCAALFFAVPPPEKGDFCYLYDEIYIRYADSEMFAQAMRHKCQGQEFEWFIIDHHGGQIREMGSGLSVEEQYSEALRRYRVSCRTTGCDFTWGSAAKKSGIEAARLWLRARDDGTTHLRVFKDKMPNFIWECKHYRHKRIAGVVTDDTEDRGRTHAVACLRYLASFRPRWVRPVIGSPRISGAILAFKRLQDKDREGQRSGLYCGPGKGA